MGLGLILLGSILGPIYADCWDSPVDEADSDEYRKLFTIITNNKETFLYTLIIIFPQIFHAEIILLKL